VIEASGDKVLILTRGGGGTSDPNAGVEVLSDASIERSVRSELIPCPGSFAWGFVISGGSPALGENIGWASSYKGPAFLRSDLTVDLFLAVGGFSWSLVTLQACHLHMSKIPEKAGEQLLKQRSALAWVR
jgi:hypothetical protein